MGKSARAKKAKKADFAKVKLKVGKSLKKAQNETKTNFKSRKIILKEQLQLKSTKTLVTKKQHDIKELLSQVSYHNIYVRQDGLNGLRELINRYDSALLIPHLSTFVNHVAPCILDADSLIRSAAIKFMEALIIKMGPSIEPYFKVLANYLSCAMVNLNVGVQSDSLQLMRVLIKYTPKLVARHANSVLNNFISLIARKTTVSKQTSESETIKPVVGFNFASLLQQGSRGKNSLAGHAGRLSLLVELSNFLEAILAEQSRIQEEIPFTTWETVLIGSVPPVMCNDTTLNKVEELWLFSEPKKLEEFTNTVISLLMQLWVEVDSQKSEDSSAGGNALNEEGVDTLSCIVSIITHIWRITSICTQEHPKKCLWLKGHFHSDFIIRIYSGFPFCCQVTPLQNKKKKKNKEAEQDRQFELQKQNLKRCDDLNVVLALFGTQMSFKGHRLKAVNFLSQLLRDGNRDGQYNMNTVIKVIKELLPPALKAEVQTIISAAYSCFTRLHPLKKDRSLLLELLLVATDIDHKYMLNYSCVNLWVEDVVKNLVTGDVREPLLQAAINLRLRGNTKIKSLLFSEKKAISETIKAKGVQQMTARQVEEKLNFLLKD